MTRRWAVLLLVLGGCGKAPDPQREICGNGIDDDKNGLTDCQDPDCSGQNGCPVLDAGYFGPCLKCGKSCLKQDDCLAVDFTNDTPLPECVAYKCQMLNSNVELNYQVDTQSTWNGVGALGSSNTRFISKTALDGSAVTCAVVQAQAMGKTEADAAQIEKSGKFNLRSFDVTRVQAMGGAVITQPFLNVGTGTNFLIWTEFWYGPPGTLTKLPTGNRIGWGCFESGASVAEVKPADDCTPGSDAGCRTIRVMMPGPQ